MKIFHSGADIVICFPVAVGSWAAALLAKNSGAAMISVTAAANERTVRIFDVAPPGVTGGVLSRRVIYHAHDAASHCARAICRKHSYGVTWIAFASITSVSPP